MILTRVIRASAILTMYTILLIIPDSILGEDWKPVSEAQYQKNPIVFTLNEASKADQVRKVTMTSDISAISNGTKIDILLFDIEKGRGIEPGDIIQFYSSYGLIGYTHTVTSEDINRGLRKEINLQKHLIYKQINCGDKYKNKNLNNIASMLETMKKHWDISSTQPFSISLRNNKVETAHNISENIICSELSTPEATIYFKRKPGESEIGEILVPSIISSNRSNNRMFLKFQNFNALSSGQQTRILSRGMEVFSLGGEEADTIGILFSEEGNAKQIHLGSAKKEDLMGKSFMFIEESDDMGVIDSENLLTQDEGLLSPNYLFNILQYNPRKIGIRVNYDEDQRIITDIEPHENSIRNVYGVEDKTFLFWGQLKPRPKIEGRNIIKRDLTVGYDQTRDGYLLTYLDWLDEESLAFNVNEGTLNATIYFQRIPSVQGYYRKISRRDFSSTIYTDRNRIIRVELDESAIAEKIGQKEQVLLHFDVVEEKYSGSPVLFLNYLDNKDKIWDNPPENADVSKWRSGLLFPLSKSPESEVKIVFEPKLMVFDENGNTIDLQKEENRKWLVTKKKPKYPLLIAAGGFCYLVLASLLML